MLKPNRQPRDLTFLKALTPARLALTQHGVSLSTKDVLAFRLAQAEARDALHTHLDFESLEQTLTSLALTSLKLTTQAPNHETYLKSPPLGKKLSQEAKELLSQNKNSSDIAIVLAGGLSPEAVNRYAVSVLNVLVPRLKYQKLSLAPVSLVNFARVKLSDEIGTILGAKLVVMLIGERPGLSAPHSLGVYLTYEPQESLTDERRNCISNIHERGLSTSEAAAKTLIFVEAMLERKISGVTLKKTESSEPDKRHLE